MGIDNRQNLLDQWAFGILSRQSTSVGDRGTMNEV